METPGRRLDLAVGILLGIVLGVVIVVLFLFLGSQETIDAPSIDEGAGTTARPTKHSGER